MRQFKPSRILNENAIFMGITFEDIVGFAVVSMTFLYPALFMGKVIYALPFVFIFFSALVQLRIKHRRHIIRDGYKYLTAEKVIHVPTNYRNNKS